MKLTFADWIIVAAYFGFHLAIGFYYKSKAGKNISEFFLSGRNVPWWLAGTSMVATTFAADTPLAVTGMVARNGIAGNWLWWNSVASGMLTVFLFARLWRRSGVMTDVEFAELRYSGKPAAFLRGFRALYLGIPINCIILGWVNLAMVKILGLVLGISRDQALLVVLGMIALTSFISILSGLWGVLVTDVFQFVIKMSMVIVLAVAAVGAVGGLDQMKIKLAAVDQVRNAASHGSGSVMNFVPDLHSAWMPMITFMVLISMNWWASWYPGAEPGGGYVAQRMFSAKDERHSLLATLWFNIAHYRFWQPGKSDRHYVTVSQWATVFLTIVSIVLTYFMDSIAHMWKLMLVTGAGTVARLAPDVEPSRDGLWNLLDWLCGCVLIYGILFGAGKLLLKEYTSGAVFLAAGLLAGGVIYWDLSRRGWKSVID